MADDAGAKARLEAAVQRLETALGRVVDRGGAGAGDIAGLRQELKGLDSQLAEARAERDNLAGELAAARAEGANSPRGDGCGVRPPGRRHKFRARATRRIAPDQ